MASVSSEIQEPKAGAVDGKAAVDLLLPDFRSEMVEAACKFMATPKVRQTSFGEQKDFLIRKGVTEAEIEEARRRLLQSEVVVEHVPFRNHCHFGLYILIVYSSCYNSLLSKCHGYDLAHRRSRISGSFYSAPERLVDLCTRSSGSLNWFLLE